MPRWSADQVLSLAPDASAQRAARALAGDKAWCEVGVQRRRRPAAHRVGALPGQRQAAVPDLRRPDRAGVPLLLPEPQVSLQAHAGHPAALGLRRRCPRRPRRPGCAQWQASRADRVTRAAGGRSRPATAARAPAGPPARRPRCAGPSGSPPACASSTAWLADQVRGGLAAGHPAGLRALGRDGRPAGRRAGAGRRAAGAQPRRLRRRPGAAARRAGPAAAAHRRVRPAGRACRRSWPRRCGCGSACRCRPKQVLAGVAGPRPLAGARRARRAGGRPDGPPGLAARRARPAGPRWCSRSPARARCSSPISCWAPRSTPTCASTPTTCGC